MDLATLATSAAPVANEEEEKEKEKEEEEEEEEWVSMTAAEGLGGEAEVTMPVSPITTSQPIVEASDPLLAEPSPELPVEVQHTPIVEAIVEVPAIGEVPPVMDVPSIGEAPAIVEAPVQPPPTSPLRSPVGMTDGPGQEEEEEEVAILSPILSPAVSPALSPAVLTPKEPLPPVALSPVTSPLPQVEVGEGEGDSSAVPLPLSPPSTLEPSEGGEIDPPRQLTPEPDESAGLAAEEEEGRLVSPVPVDRAASPDVLPDATVEDDEEEEEDFGDFSAPSPPPPPVPSEEGGVDREGKEGMEQVTAPAVDSPREVRPYSSHACTNHCVYLATFI